MTSMRGPCCEVVGNGFPPPRCKRIGNGVVLTCPAGRPDATGGPYCDEHGGEARADREASSDWNLLAPASVGDAEAVEHAGCLCLTTADAYVVIRCEAGKEGGPASDRWLAWLGIGSHMVGVSNPASRVEIQPGEDRRGRKLPHRRRRETMDEWRTRVATVGGYAFPTRDDALAEATRVWRESVTRHVEEIRAARGGTLSWGTPVEPLSEPIVIDSPPESAWDIAVALARKAGPGVSLITGLRPSGEAA